MNFKGTRLNPVQAGPASIGKTVNWNPMWQQEGTVPSGVKTFFSAMTLTKITCRQKASGK